MNIETTIVKESISLKKYVHSCPPTSMIAIAQDTKIECPEHPDDYAKNRRKAHQDAYTTKVLHGQYQRQTMNIVDHDETYASNSNLKRETEALIMAAQKQSLRTNSIRVKIDRAIDSGKCRMCKQLQETSEHLVSGCSKLAQKEYKRRHDKIATLIH